MLADIFEAKDEETKVYKIKEYKNSDGDPFGLTINAKQKEYVEAHAKFKELLKNFREYNVESGKLKVFGTNKTKSKISSTIEVSSSDGNRGKVDLNVYNPGKKGATIEIRKAPDFDYDFVIKAKNSINSLIDKFMNGIDLESVVRESKKKILNKNVPVEKEKKIGCDSCEWKTVSSSALKAHITRVHMIQQKISCDVCDYKAENKSDMIDHIEAKHDSKKIFDEVLQSCRISGADKIEGTSIEELSSLMDDVSQCDEKSSNRKRIKSSFKCDNCQSTFDDENRLKEHIAQQHPIFGPAILYLNRDDKTQTSPPRKFQNIVDDSDVEMKEVDSIENETNDMKIKEWSKELEIVQDENFKLKKEIIKLKENIEVSKKKKKLKTILLFLNI